MGRLLLTAWFAARAGRFRLTQPRPEQSARVLRPGLSPMRVLVAGAGLAAGYGVRTQEQGLAGSMSRELADISGRGVTVDFTVQPLMPASTAVDRIGPVGAHTYGVAVFAPCYLEDSFHPAGGIRRHGDSIVKHLLQTGGPGVRVVLVGLPQPAGSTRVDIAAARAADRTNATMRAIAARQARVAYVAPPPFGSMSDRTPFDADYYDALGSSIARTVLQFSD